MKRRLLAVALTSALVSCSLFTSLDGLTGAPFDTDASADAAPDGPAKGADGGIDAPMGADASDAAVADARGPFCASRTGLVFCADFDETSSPESGWNGGAEGTLARSLDDAHLVSSPHALKVSAPAMATDTANAVGALVEMLPGSPTRIEASADLWVEDPKPSGNAVFIVFALFIGSNYDVYLQIDPDGTHLVGKLAPASGGSAQYEAQTAAAVPYGQWVHVVMLYEATPSPVLTLTMTPEGSASTTSTTFPLSLASQATKDRFGVRAGLPYLQGTTAAASVWTDDVTLASTM